MSLTLRPDDPRLSWHGAVSIERTDEWVMPWRLQFEQMDLFPGISRAAMPAGVRLTFQSDARLLAGSYVPFSSANHPARLDLCVDGSYVASAELDGKDRFQFDTLAPGLKRLELWLPQVCEFRLRSLELSGDDTLAPADDPRPRWITYGSSITQCAAASSPTQTWPAIVARERGLNLTCLGFGGQCHIEPMVARLIRDLSADFISLCLGINVYGARSLTARTFRPAVLGFIAIVRERHPDIPLVVISPIVSAPRETEPNAAGLSLALMRQEIAEAVESLQAHGDGALHYVDGLRIFGPELEHLQPDQVHPDADGYRALARNFLREVAEPFFRH